MTENIAGSYYTYLKNSSNKSLEKSEYIKYNNLFNKFLISKVLQGFEVALPKDIGTLSVIGNKQKPRLDSEGNIIGLAPNWVETNKLWKENEEARKNKKIVYFMNHHSDGVKYRYLWSRAKVSLKNKTLYSLTMTRANKREVAKLIKSGKQFKIKM